jgi:hypothetical protein
MHGYHPNNAGSINKRITVQAGLGINMRPYLEKYLKQKKAGDMVYVVEHLHRPWVLTPVLQKDCPQFRCQFQVTGCDLYF